MKIVVAPDKFKGSLTAVEVAEAMARGVRRGCRSARIETVPMADGGEGTVEALAAATGGTFHEFKVTGPMGAPVSARFAMLGDGETAVLEMAAASGLVLVPGVARDPRRATTRGTGELLLEAVRRGARRVILGIGGSATNDGGAGLAQALGYRLLDGEGKEIGPGGGALAALDRIDAAGRNAMLLGVEVSAACDVENPLCGPTGASAVYGPQKGATPEMVRELDENLERLARIILRDLGASVADIPGSGAAGGLGAGLVAFANGRLERGVTLVIEAVGLAERLEGADLCLTGEGAVDASSAFGKTAVGISRLASSMGIPTIALAGSIGPGAEDVLDQGINAYFSICPGPTTLDDAIANAREYLEKAAEHATRAFLAGRRDG